MLQVFFKEVFETATSRNSRRRLLFSPKIVLHSFLCTQQTNACSTNACKSKVKKYMLVFLTLKKCQICSKLAIETERHSGVFIANFEHNSYLFLVLLLLILNRKMFAMYVLALLCEFPLKVHICYKFVIFFLV